jgi:ferredoxin like protein
MAIEDKLTTTRFNVDKEPHIKVNAEICETCPEKVCLYVCPAQNYVLSENKVVFSWQGCLECGACRLACNRGAIDWSYPRGGFGVCLRYG